MPPGFFNRIDPCETSPKVAVMLNTASPIWMAFSRFTTTFWRDNATAHPVIVVLAWIATALVGAAAARMFLPS